jgi:DNA polymerase III delta subunit
VQRTGEVSGPKSEKPAEVLTSLARDAGLTLSSDAVKLVLSRVGGDAGMLPSVVETLASVHGSDAQLDVADVEPYLTDVGAIPMWDLTNAIERGDIPESLAVLQRLLTVTSPSQPKVLHPLEIMGFLHGHYRRLLRLDDPQIRTNEDAAAALGGRGSARGAGFRLRQARALGTDGLRQAFDHLASADLDLKGERAIPPDTVMSVLVARLAALTTRSARAGGRRR